MTDRAPDDPRILGTFDLEDGVGIVRIEDRLDAAVDDVWSAITDPARLARWYGDVEGSLRLGGEFRAKVHMSGWEGTGRITECDPPHRLATVSKEPDDPTEAVHTVTLARDGDQTVVVYENRSVPVDLLWAYGVGEQLHVEDLAGHLAGRERDASKSRWDALEPTYREAAEKIGPQR